MQLQLGTKQVAGFRELIEAYPDNSFASPTRSTVLLLDFWRESEARWQEFSKLLEIDRFHNVTLSFEHPMAVMRGRGKPSFTDLMILGSDVAVAIEAKFREPAYDSVEKWLGSSPAENRLKVLGGWLECIGSAVGRPIARQDVSKLTYQLIHRTASVCAKDVTRRFVVYHYFDAHASPRPALSEWRELLGTGSCVRFVVMSTDASKGQVWTELVNGWQRHERADMPRKLRAALKAAPLMQFGSTRVEFV